MNLYPRKLIKVFDTNIFVWYLRAHFHDHMFWKLIVTCEEMSQSDVKTAPDLAQKKIKLMFANPRTEIITAILTCLLNQ